MTKQTSSRLRARNRPRKDVSNMCLAASYKVKGLRDYLLIGCCCTARAAAAKKMKQGTLDTGDLDVKPDPNLDEYPDDMGF
jgi:hypothetical protein